MSKLRRLENPIQAHFCNSALLRAIDECISDVPVYFRQKDAELYFYNPPLIRRELNRQLSNGIQYLWFSPPSRSIRFDDRFLKPYTNKELLDVMGIPYSLIQEELRLCDQLDFSYLDTPFPTPSGTIEEATLAYLKACSSSPKESE